MQLPYGGFALRSVQFARQVHIIVGSLAIDVGNGRFGVVIVKMIII